MDVFDISGTRASIVPIIGIGENDRRIVNDMHTNQPCHV